MDAARTLTEPFAPLSVEQFIELSAFRVEAVRWGDRTISASADYMRREGIDREAISVHAGSLILACVSFRPDGFFDFASAGGDVAAVIEVLGEDRRVVDLCAWNLDWPEIFGTAIGFLPVLGADQIANPATYYAGDPLAVSRTPLAWCKAGCRGVAVLDDERAGSLLAQALGPVVGEDRAHARSLLHSLQRHASAPRVGFIEARA